MLAALALLVPMAEAGAANICRVPDQLPEARVRPVPPGETRLMPVTDYTLSLSWSPQYCRTRGEAKDALQCAGPNRFGFVLHGLWPEGESQAWPQYCRPVEAVPREVVRKAFCATPSVELIQHEWAKHGSCMAEDPARYFTAATILFDALKWPDMARLSRQGVDVRGFVRAVAAANPGLPDEAMAVRLNNGGWLEELRICLNLDFRPMVCPKDVRGARGRERVRIWRG